MMNLKIFALPVFIMGLCISHTWAQDDPLLTSKNEIFI